MWRRGVMVMTTPQLHSAKPELRFCGVLNPAPGVFEIGDGGGTLTMVQTGNKVKSLSSVNHTTKAVNHHHQMIR